MAGKKRGGPLGKAVEGVKDVFSTVGSVVGHVLVLPVDCLFCLYDILWVNFKKTRLFGLDCRGRRTAACPPGGKYTNKWLFRLLVCRDALPEAVRITDTCSRSGARTVKIYFGRGLVVVLVTAAVFGGGAYGAFYYVKEVNPQLLGTKGRRELAEKDIRAGKTAFEAGNYGKALNHYKNALKILPGRKQVAYRAGQCLQKQGNMKAASGYYKRAIRGEDGVPDAARKLALFHYGEARLRQGRALAKRAVELGLEDARCEAMLAEYYFVRGEDEKAEKHLEHAVELAPERNIVRAVQARMLLSKDKIDKAASTLKEGKGMAPKDLISWRLCQSRLYRKQGRPEAALKELKSLISKFPDVARLEVYRAELLLETGHTEEAFDQIDKLRRAFSLRPNIKLHLARLLAQYGRDGQALGMAEKLAEEDGETGNGARVLAARLYAGHAFPERARKYVNQVLDNEPDNVDAHLLAGRLALQDGDRGKAQTHFRSVIDAEPDSATARYLLGVSYLASDNSREAVEQLAKASELKPESGEFHYDYAKALLATGKTAGTEAALKKAAKYMSEPYKAHTRLGLMAHKEKNYQTAAEYYRKAMREAPAKATIAANNMAELMLNSGRKSPMVLALAYMGYVNSEPPLRKETADTFTKALLSVGQVPAALPSARIASEGRPDNPARLLRLGIAEHAAGNKQKALAALRKAQEKGKGKKISDVAAKVLREITSEDIDEDGKEP